MGKANVESRRKWNSQEDSILIDMFRRGCSLKKIASVLNRTTTSVNTHIQRMRMHDPNIIPLRNNKYS